MILTHSVEVWERVPDPGCPRVLRHRSTEHLVVRAVRLAALLYVVAPADAVLVQEICEIGPGVVRGLASRVAGATRRRARVLHGRAATHRIALAGAVRRPTRDQIEVLGQAPRRIRL